jgi:hypothetical protein
MNDTGATGITGRLVPERKASMLAGIELIGIDDLLLPLLNSRTLVNRDCPDGVGLGVSRQT